MSEWAEDQDPYEVLGLTQRHESTEAEIRKAYRLLALKKHPDKQPNNPNAAAEFHPIQRAFDVLSDAQARAALDDLHRAKAARKAREAGQSEKRRKMREDLEKRESSYQTARNDEQRARNKLKEELDRLRKQATERRANHAAEVSLAFAQASGQPQPPVPTEPQASAAEYQPAAPQQELTEELLRTLKVSWDKQGTSNTYSADDLKQIMSAHGVVEDVVLLPQKKKKTASALVVMQTLEAASAAAEAVNGSLSNPLLVVPFAKAAAPSNAAKIAPQHQADALPKTYAPAAPQHEHQSHQQPQQQQHQQQHPQQHNSHSTLPTDKSSTTPTPPSSPIKTMPVRNPFGGIFRAGVPSSQASFNLQKPAFAATAASKPLFAAGASMSSSYTPAGPFGASNGSYTSFPGGLNAPQTQAELGRNHVAQTVQAGMKRAFEDATLLKLRQAADQARAIQQLRTGDAGQSE